MMRANMSPHSSAVCGSSKTPKEKERTINSKLASSPCRRVTAA
jgi:hypothetical protein